LDRKTRVVNLAWSHHYHRCPIA